MKDNFKIIYKHSADLIRLGTFDTPHGRIETPCFVPVATLASMKALDSSEMHETKTQLAFVNTYHLHLRPGEGVINKFGGVHRFMSYDGPLISDSGGFQAFSLGYGLVHGVGKIAKIFPDEQINQISIKKTKESMAKIDDTGVTFRSHLDGNLVRLTPESSIKIQEQLATDIALALDECTSPLSPKPYVIKALQRTHLWALQCLKYHRKKNQALFGVVQGGHFRDLRTEACKYIGNLPFDGFAIGGDFGRSKQEMVDITAYVMQNLPSEKMRHVLGIGEIDDIFRIIENGADSFDCVMPTRLGRMGHVLSSRKMKTKYGKRTYSYDIDKTIYAEDKTPLDERCDCAVCRKYSRGYVRHLFHARELTAYSLITFHNVYFLNNLVTMIRRSIIEKKFNKLKSDWLD